VWREPNILEEFNASSAFSRLPGMRTQNIGLFIATTVRTSNPIGITSPHNYTYVEKVR
jgi:hypothetical protein